MAADSSCLVGWSEQLLVLQYLEERGAVENHWVIYAPWALVRAKLFSGGDGQANASAE